MEKKYEFRMRMLAVHTPRRREGAAPPGPGECALTGESRIVVPAGAGRVLLRAALDMQDYLFVSMGLSVRIEVADDPEEMLSSSSGYLLLTTRAQSGVDLLDGDAPRGYRIDCGENIVVTGYDEAGAMQGGFRLEELMNLRGAPYVPRGTVARRPLFSPRMVHSGYGLDQFPDAHIAAIAHAGMDAILVFVKGVDTTPAGYQDFNELCWRAAEYGVDVYAYSYLTSEVHPDDPGAAAYYDRVYGSVFRSCPAFRGVVLVGESVEFPSRDERTTGKSHRTPSEDGLPANKPNPGWWPCRDFPQWLALIRDTVRRYRADADIVFWTYNWGYAPESDRIALIDALPTDISLLVTFEMFENRNLGPVTVSCVDYTLMFEGPGHYFLSEAKAAARRGIRLYAMTNTGGLTWDIGVIPYEPAPGQWTRRHRAILAARERYGLTGLMESHHFGFWPSFISELAKEAFTSGSAGPDATLRALAVRDFGEDNADAVLAAWELWSEGIRHYVSTNEDQYGPFRIGPSYPLVLCRDVRIPDSPHAHFGNRICKTLYGPMNSGRFSVLSLRLSAEIESLSVMEENFARGARIIAAIAPGLPEPLRDSALRMANLGEFISRCAHTVINVKKWYRMKMALLSATGGDAIAALVRDMTALARDEIANAEATIPLVRMDSRLGWEPSMDYLCDEAHLRWKIRQVEQMLQNELSLYSDSLRFGAAKKDSIL